MRAKKIDSNQPELVRQIRGIPGTSVTHTHELGGGMVDIIIGYKKKNFLCEIKDPKKPKSARKLTIDEERFHAEWKGQIAIIETIDDIFKLIL